MRYHLLKRAYQFLDEMATATNRSGTGRVTGNMPAPSVKGSSMPSSTGSSANTMTRRSVSTKPMTARPAPR